MQDTIASLYPRLLAFWGILVLFIGAVALIPGTSDATVTTATVQTTASDTSRKLSPEDCRPDHFAHGATCTVQGRTVRVINF